MMIRSCEASFDKPTYGSCKVYFHMWTIYEVIERLHY